MIGLLRGRLAAANLDAVLIDVGGVGYRVRVPPGTVPGAVGEEVTVHTHLAVREDALTLYGFAEAAARDLFETLLGVTGFGPKLALAAVGTLGAEGLRRAVLEEDVDALTVVPGVGRKSAQRVILELGERLGVADAPTVGLAESGAAADPRSEVREALAGLGYAAAEVQRTMAALPAEGAEDPEALLREALRLLGARQ